MSLSPIQRALQAALDGPEVKRLEVYGHHWNVKPAHIRKEGDTVTVEGQISHNVKWTQDDQAFYEFVYKKGELIKNDNQIEERGWAEIAAPIVSAIGAYYGKPIPPAEIEKIGNIVENLAHGNWQNAVQKLAMRIGLEGYKRMYSVTAYTEPNFKGVSQTFTPGTYLADDFWAVGNDRISSLKVPPDMEVLVCKHRPGVGKPEECKTYTKDVANVDSVVKGVSYLKVVDRNTSKINVKSESLPSRSEGQK